jgi:aminoglycoside 6'-N-acetyltransferase
MAGATGGVRRAVSTASKGRDRGPALAWRPVTVLQGSLVRLRLASEDDIPELVRIRLTPEVYARWRGGDDMVAAVREDFAEPDSTGYVIELGGRIVGWIQWQAEEEPDYRHASIDVYVDPAHHGRGVGTDAVRTLARHLFAACGHHRIEIDPAADNAAAIRAYTKVGFRPVGITRQSERGPDGTWHDSLLMDLLADDLLATEPGSEVE